MLDGLLLIDKPAGPTSHDIVDFTRRWAGQRRIGHTGTLDPAATGLLVMVLGKATRLSQWMVGADKDYEGTIRFGIGTETLDAEGAETSREACLFTEDALQEAVAAMIGVSTQIPPKFSAIKIGGAPAYRLARQGREPALESRLIAITNFTADLVEDGDFPLYGFSLSCSSGTYVRSIAADLGQALGRPAHLAGLRRTRVGHFQIRDAVTPEHLKTEPAPEAGGALLPMSAALDLPQVTVVADELTQLFNGRAVHATGNLDGAFANGTTVQIFEPGSKGLLGLGKIESDRVKPFLILHSSRE